MLLSTSRLSKSPLWHLQKMAYAQLGVESWAKGRVPFQMTNNSRIAAQYADIACAAFPKRPFTVLELGGGCGKFAFLFLSELLRRENPGVRYILTDASEKNVAFWNCHSQLVPWINEGILQTFVFDPLTDDPLFADLVIANYFFDSIPQDLFRIEKGVLFEGIVSLHGEVDVSDWNDPALLPKIRIEYAFDPLKENPYPEFPEAWKILEEYSRQIDDFSFLFPIGALQSIRRMIPNWIESSRDSGTANGGRIDHTAPFAVPKPRGFEPAQNQILNHVRYKSFSGDDFLLLAADRGPCMAEDLRRMPLLPSLHGSAFSFPVNFHAIGQYMELKGGAAIFSQTHEPVAKLASMPKTGSHAVDFSIALLSRKPTLAKQCFESQAFGPLKMEATGFTDILKCLEEANWDAMLFFSFFDRIQELFTRAEDVKKKEMFEGMRRIRGQFFPMFGEEALLLERLGLFFQSLGEEEEAAAHFRLAARFSSLPRLEFKIEAFLEANPPSGDVLQIGGKKDLFESIRSLKIRKYIHIGWNESMEALERFDTIFLFPPPLIARERKPAFIRDIEERFSLDTIRYSDADIETFFSTLSITDPKQAFRFFVELERKKNISRDQFHRIAKRLGMMEAPLEEEDRFFETLMVCLKKHMKSGSVLRAFLPGIATYDEQRFFEQVMVDPYFETEEQGESEGVWVTVRKL